jgi:hypothetical protein
MFFRAVLIILSFLPAISYSETKTAPQVHLGTCGQLDSYLYYCKPFSCKFSIPGPSGSKADAKLEVIEEKEGQCYYNILFEVFYNNQVIPYKLASKCILTPEGKIEAVKEFQSYRDGNTKVYTQSSQNPILQKECQHGPG